MSILADILKFSLFVFFSYLVPGYILIDRINLSSKALKIFLSISLGFVISALAGFVDSKLYYFLILVSALIFIAKRGYKGINLKPKITLAIALSALVILLGTFFQNLIPFRSGLRYDFGVGYWGALGHDGVWHEALVNQLVKKVPPQNPGFAGVTLTNYHYFYDLLVAQSVKLTRIAVPDLIYRYYPIFFSLLLGLGTYLLAEALFKNRWVNLLAVYLAYFGSSFGWIVEWIKTRTLGGESDFWANQPVSFNINPPFAVSLVLFIAAIILVKSFLEKKEFWKGFGLVLVSGALIEFKVYGGLIVLGSLALLSVKKAVFEKDYSLFGVTLASILLALAIFLPGSSKLAGFVAFYPLWIVDSMVDIVDRVGWPRLSLARQVGLAEKQWPKYIAAQAIGIFLFIVGNLGTRVLAFASVFTIPVKKWFQDNFYFFLATMVLAAFIPTLLFVQKGDPWNIIQFTYYGLYLFAVFGAYGAYWVASIIPGTMAGVFLVIFLVITPISSVTTFLSGFSGEVAYIGNDELEALEVLKRQPEGSVLTFPFNIGLKNLAKGRPLPLWAYETSAYVAANSQKATYLEDIKQQNILGSDYQDRLTLAKDFFAGAMSKKEEQNFISENNISYIYVPKDLLPIIKRMEAVTLFENEGAIIYKTGI